MFAIFTRLTRDEGAPLGETLRRHGRRRRWRRRDHGLLGALPALMVVPVILGLVTTLVFLAVNSPAAPRGCGVAMRVHGLGVPIRSCQPGLNSPGHF